MPSSPANPSLGDKEVFENEGLGSIGKGGAGEGA